MQLLLTLRDADKFGLMEASKPLPRDGALSIGRGKQAGWTLPDPTRMVSAVHCEIRSARGRVFLTDFSKNGTRINGQAMTKMSESEVKAGDEIELGPFVLMISANGGGGAAQDQKTVVLGRGSQPRRPPSPAEDKTVIDGWTVAREMPTADPHPPRAPHKQPHTPGRISRASPGSRRFVDAFCEGAGLDPDALASRADGEFAQELGALMRILVTGMHRLSDSIADLRTVAGSAGQGGFRSDEEAVPSGATGRNKRTDRSLIAQFGTRHPDGAGDALNGAIDDAVRHDKAMFFAMQTALFRLLNELSPGSIERDTKTGLIRSKSARNWNAFLHRWEMLSTSGEDGMLDVFIQYFREAYDAKMQEP